MQEHYASAESMRLGWLHLLHRLLTFVTTFCGMARHRHTNHGYRTTLSIAIKPKHLYIYCRYEIPNLRLTRHTLGD
jgi:hypothetical protein